MRKITGLMITVEEITESDLHEIVVVACDEHSDIFRTKGMMLEEAWEYVRMMQKFFCLPNESVDCAVFDNDRPKLTRIK